MSWKRPNNIPFPSVWERFQGKILIDGKPLSYTVQDVTEDLMEPVVDHMCRYFLVREIMLSTHGVIEDEIAYKEVRQLWTDMVSQKMSLVALVDGDEEPTKRIAGCNILEVVQKNDPKRKFEGIKMDTIVRSMAVYYERANVYERYGVDKYLNAFGLSVAPQYQGDNIGYYLLKSRTPLCQATGVPMTVTPFSHPAAIYEALKDGFQIIADTMLDRMEVDNKKLYPRLKSRFVLTVKIIPKLN